jgi:hypothetical protein
LNKSEKDALWKDLKAQWGNLKRGSNATESEKGTSKERINEIQEKLGLEKTNWNANRQQPGSHLQSGGAATSPSNNALVEKILGTVLETRREMNETLMTLTQKMNRMEEKPCNCNCNVDTSS